MITEEVKGHIAKQPLSLEEMISKRNEEAAAKSKVCTGLYFYFLTI